MGIPRMWVLSMLCHSCSASKVSPFGACVYAKSLISSYFPDDVPGLSACQARDLRLDDAYLHYYGNTIGEGLGLWL